jgi:hypothetical protein
MDDVIVALARFSNKHFVLANQPLCNRDICMKIIDASDDDDYNCMPTTYGQFYVISALVRRDMELNGASD